MNTLADKVTAAIVYLLTVEIAVALALAINFMYDYHFYSSDSAYYPIHKAMSMKSEKEHDRIEEYAVLSVKAEKGLNEREQSAFEALKKKYSPEKSNVVFKVKDANGNIILSNDEEFTEDESCYFKSYEISADIDEENHFTGTVFIYVRREANANDSYKLALWLISLAQSLKYVIFIVLFALVILACFLLGMLMFSVGKFEEDRKYLNVIQRVPFDVFSIIVFGLIGFAVALILLTSAADVKNTNIVLWNTIVLLVEFCVCVVLLVYCLSLALRIKEGNIFENTLLIKIISKIKKKKNHEEEAHLKLPYIGKALFVLGVAMVGDLVTIFYFIYKYKIVENNMLSEFNFLYFAFMQLACVFIIGSMFFLIVFNLNSIKESGKRIASGDYEGIQDSHIMFGDFKAINDDLIAIKDEMIKALEEKSKSQDMRNELITNISHDIKTPLTSIVNYADIIGSGRCSEEEAKAYSEIILHQSERLKELIRGLIEVSRISTGNIEVNFEETDISILVMQAVEEFLPRFEQREIETFIKIPDDGVIINADGSKLWRIFENLLSNICKYAKQGTRADIIVTRKNGKIILTVKNVCESRITVPGDELAMRFTRNDASRHTEGHGLGLSIAKSFTELQGGCFEIFVEDNTFEARMTFEEYEKNSRN